MADGVLDDGMVEQILRSVREHGGSLDTNLLESGLITEAQLVPYLETVYTLQNRVDPFGDPQPEALRLLRPDQAERYRVVPMRREVRAVDVLVADPTNVRILDEVAFITGCRLITSVACECRVASLLHQAYQIALPTRLAAILAGECVRREEMEVFLARRRAPDKPMPLDDTAPLHTKEFEETGEVRRSYHQLAEKLDACVDLEEVPAIVLPYLQVLLSRVVLFHVQPQFLRGWDARGPRLRREAVELIRVKLSTPSVFRWVLETGSSFAGPVPQEDVEEDLLIRLAGQSWPEHALVVPVASRDRVAAILYGEATGAEALRKARQPAEVIADLVGKAVTRLTTPRG